MTRSSAAKSARQRNGRGVSGVEAELPVFPPNGFPLEMTVIYILTNLFTRMYKIRVEQELGISLIEWRIIDSVANAPGMIAKQLIDYFGIDKTLLSRTLINLEAEGLLEQHVFGRDLRVKALYLTAEGEKIYKRSKVAKDQMLAEVCSVVSRKDFEAFKATAGRMIDFLKMKLAEETGARTRPE